MTRLLRLTAAASLVLGLGAVTLAPAEAAAPKKYPNCAALNNTYPHGVAVRKGVRDKTSGKPVTNYTVNKAVYDLNKSRLDRDKDGIACEKR